MNLLLDTSTFLWLNLDRSRLPAAVLTACESDSNRLFVSSVSAWEIAVKNAAGRLPLPEPPSQFFPARRELIGAAPLPIDEEACLQTGKLPQHDHRDPFDRMLVCQAILLGLVIVTPDIAFQKYPVRTLW
ncbi:MAG: type II toxin-antitoxin system VapC family toxin [Bryobacteraceae bacterium]